MTIVNIRGTSGSGKSTLVHRFIAEHVQWDDGARVVPIERTLDNWKKPKIVAYKVFVKEYEKPYDDGIRTGVEAGGNITYVIGRYETQCGGCDSMSYKGSHTDIENLIREFLPLGNVIFEGLTISSTITRWLRISQENPGQFVWAFMNTPEEECYRRIIARSGREPKRDAKGSADYNRKHHGCQVQRQKLLDMGEKVIDIASDDEGYRQLLDALTHP